MSCWAPALLAMISQQQLCRQLGLLAYACVALQRVAVQTCVVAAAGACQG